MKTTRNPEYTTPNGDFVILNPDHITAVSVEPYIALRSENNAHSVHAHNTGGGKWILGGYKGEDSEALAKEAARIVAGELWPS